MTVFRAEIPLAISYFGANALAFIAYRYSNYALINLIGDQPKLQPTQRQNLLLFCLYLIGLYLTGALFGRGYQTVFVSLCVSYLSIKGAFLALKIYKKNQIDLIQIYAILLFLTGVLWFARVAFCGRQFACRLNYSVAKIHF